MKKRFALFLVLCVNNLFAQPDSLKIYHWTDLKGDFNPDTIYAISFSQLKLDTVPSDLFKFKNVKYLDLSKNRITGLPSEFTSLMHLESLNLAKNKLSIFPIEFCRMSSLKEIILNRNEIEQLPNCIELLVDLEYIDLYDNPIRTLPESLITLKKLKKVDLSGIRFSPTFQESWLQKLPNVELVFDAPCDCME